MENQKSRNLSKIGMILGIIVFLLALTFVLVKYFSSGEFDITTLLTGIVIPGLIWVLFKAADTKSS